MHARPEPLLDGALASFVERGPNATSDRAEVVVSPFKCDERIVPAAAAPVRLEASFPPVVERTGGDTFEGQVRLLADGRVDAVAPSEADVYVTALGVVVATPLPRDLDGVLIRIDPGAARSLPARGTIRSCATGPHDDLLPAGAYEVHAVVTLAGDGGAPVELVSDPCPLVVR